MPPVGFDPTISAGEWPQTYAIDRAAIGIGIIYLYWCTVTLNASQAICSFLSLSFPTRDSNGYRHANDVQLIYTVCATEGNQLDAVHIDNIFLDCTSCPSSTASGIPVPTRSECLLSFGAESFVFEFAIQKFKDIQNYILQLGPWIFKLRRNKTNEMHIQSKVNHISRISMLLLHVSVLYERHLEGAQRILMKLCLCYVISAVLSEGREWVPSVCCQSVGSGYRLCVASREGSGYRLCVASR
jgi:hypothetical protein